MLITSLLDDMEFLARRQLEAVETEDWIAVEAYDQARLALAAALNRAMHTSSQPANFAERLSAILSVCADTKTALDAADWRRRSLDQSRDKNDQAKIAYRKTQLAINVLE
jgi:2-oxo-4-hydroxy-4-carboxy--5-ureidoimidazoline (OHCU) decarboxylase